MSVAVDSNILLDIVGATQYADAVQETIEEALDAGQLIVCPVVPAELVAHFPDYQALHGFLSDIEIELRQFSHEALWRAGQAWVSYSRRRRAGLECPDCGRTFVAPCPSCGRSAAPRQHLVTDFLIGAHALTQADGLITRDQGYYRTYFPELKLMVPGRR
ncbi:MAG TPA: nucleotide-binding protein [Chloroflexota bacterium]|nr:nucleotide-binding protein [Chloroflexota bacterium]